MLDGMRRFVEDAIDVEVQSGPDFATLETTQGQIDGFCSQLPFKSCLPEVASVGD